MVPWRGARHFIAGYSCVVPTLLSLHPTPRRSTLMQPRRAPFPLLLLLSAALAASALAEAPPPPPPPPPNVVVNLSAGLLEAYVEEPVDRTQPVSTCVLGARHRGTGRMIAKTRVE